MIETFKYPLNESVWSMQVTYLGNSRTVDALPLFYKIELPLKLKLYSQFLRPDSNVCNLTKTESKLLTENKDIKKNDATTTCCVVNTGAILNTN